MAKSKAEQTHTLRDKELYLVRREGKCLFAGLPTGHLQALDAPPKRAKSKCAACKTYFEYPDDD